VSECDREASTVRGPVPLGAVAPLEIGASDSIRLFRNGANSNNEVYRHICFSPARLPVRTPCMQTVCGGEG
jgi:hypothetical protein